MTGKGKRLNSAYEKIDREAAYPLADAVKMIKASAKAKFDETVEISMNLGIDSKQSDQAVRGVVTLPNGTGKNVRVAVFARGAKAEEAKKAGADLVGAEDLAEAIQKGQIDFERCIATPDMMAIVGRLGKVLGPRGLMPNPKIGSVTNDVAQAIAGAKGGQVQYRAEKAGLVHAGVGKASFTEQQLIENINALVGAVSRARPAGIKGNFIKKVSLSSTMGPGVKLDLGTLDIVRAGAAAA